MLNITNGDSAADLIRESGIAGDVLPWRDPMHHGPFPEGLDLDALSRLRIQYLTGGSEGKPGSTHQFCERDDILRQSVNEDEVVLWFEHDLLDQLQILQLLDWYKQSENRKCRLTLICINTFPGIDNFRGLGQLSPAQIATLFPSRKEVDQSAFDYASKVWKSFRQSNPNALTQFLPQSSEAQTPLPFLPDTLLRHCQEYPWHTDGLTRTERQILTLVNAGIETPGKLFVENMAPEQYLYVGDARTYSIIESLCNVEDPLLKTKDGKPFQHSYTERDAGLARLQRLELTDAGRDLLSSNSKNGERRKRDEWLGGVHLKSGKSLWLWNDLDQSFVHAA